MPASTRLLQKLKETWGEEVTQDLVTWVNEGRSVNRAELREVADLYFARFGDRLDERIAVAEVRWGTKLEERLAAFETRFDSRVEERLRASEARLESKFDAKLDERINGVQRELDERINGVRLEVAGLRAEVALQMRDQMKWMFVFWIGTLVPLAGLIVALGKDWL